MLVGKICHNSSLRSAIDKSILYQVWFIYILDRSGILTQSRCQCIQSDRTTLEFLDDEHQDIPVILVESHLIYFQKIKCK